VNEKQIYTPLRFYHGVEAAKHKRKQTHKFALDSSKNYNISWYHGQIKERYMGKREGMALLLKGVDESEKI
jgi:hypothetical protein